MSRHTLFNRDGYIKLPPKVGDEPYHPQKTDPQAEIDFCTNCKKRKCRNGNCKELRKMKEEMKNA